MEDSLEQFKKAAEDFFNRPDQEIMEDIRRMENDPAFIELGKIDFDFKNE
jgi:hypothetical protein